MTNNVPTLLVALVDHSAIVKVNGRANFTSSVTFKRLVGELRDRGCESFVLDLSDCVTMDSTFLGVLAGTAVKLSGCQNYNARNGASAKLRLLNPNQRVTELLDNLGVADLFSTIQCAASTGSEQLLSPAEDLKPSREELSTACLEAHRVLMDLNPDNIPRFKDVAQFLAEDVKKAHSEAEHS